MSGVGSHSSAAAKRSLHVVVGAVVTVAAALLSTLVWVQPASGVAQSFTVRQSSAGEITSVWGYGSVIEPQSQRIRVLEVPVSKTTKPSTKPKVVVSKDLPRGATRHVTRNLVAGRTYRVELISVDPVFKLVSEIQLVGKPGPVLGLSASWIEGDLTVTWSPVASAESTLVGVAVSSAAGFRREVAASATAGGVRIVGADPKTTYKVLVLAKNAAGMGPVTQITSAPALPARPNVSVKPSGVGSVTLFWETAKSNALQWVVLVVAPGQKRHNESVLVKSGAGVVVGGLSSGVEYGFKVTGRNSLGDGPSSSIVSIISPAVLPRPSKPDITFSKTALLLSWSPVVDISGADVMYRVGFRPVKTSSWEYTNVSEKLAATVTGLTAGERYEVVIEAETGDGRSSQSLVSNVLIPGNPAVDVTPEGPSQPSTNNSAEIVPARLTGFAERSQVSLSWDEQPYPVQIKYRGSTGVWSIKGVQGSSVVVNELTNGVPYEFVLIRASDSIEISSMISLTPVGAPSQPQSFIANPRHSEVELRWAAPADKGGTAPLGYAITYRGSSGYGQVFVSPDTTGVVITGLTNGDTYTFTIRFDSEFGQSPTVTVTSAPAAGL